MVPVFVSAMWLPCSRPGRSEAPPAPWLLHGRCWWMRPLWQGSSPTWAGWRRASRAKATWPSWSRSPGAAESQGSAQNLVRLWGTQAQGCGPDLEEAAGPGQPDSAGRPLQVQGWCPEETAWLGQPGKSWLRFPSAQPQGLGWTLKGQDPGHRHRRHSQGSGRAHVGWHRPGW